VINVNPFAELPASSPWPPSHGILGSCLVPEGRNLLRRFFAASLLGEASAVAYWTTPAVAYCATLLAVEGAGVAV
jgi:hypothetical protein